LKLISSNVGGNAIYFQINSAIQMYINVVKLKKKNEASCNRKYRSFTTTRYRVVQSRMTHFSRCFCSTIWGRGRSMHIDEETRPCHFKPRLVSIDRWSM